LLAFARLADGALVARPSASSGARRIFTTLSKKAPMTTEHLYADHPQTAAGRRQAGLVWTLLLPALLLAASPSPDWSRYRPGRLGDLVLAHPRVQKTLVLTSVPIRAAVQYSGRLRPMADETQRFIATWAEAMSLPQAPATFHREVLVLEDGIEYWLPIQDVVADAMIRELEPGQAIEIFAVYAGQSLHDHVFLVNEFMTAGKPPAEGRRRFRRISLGELGKKGCGLDSRRW
jgi:hypothetical protein